MAAKITFAQAKFRILRALYYQRSRKKTMKILFRLTLKDHFSHYHELSRVWPSFPCRSSFGSSRNRYGIYVHRKGKRDEARDYMFGLWTLHFKSDYSKTAKQTSQLQTSAYVCCRIQTQYMYCALICRCSIQRLRVSATQTGKWGLFLSFSLATWC